MGEFTFNDERIKAFETGNYICDKCGAIMKWEDSLETTLVCPSCGNSIDADRYGFSSEEEYNEMYPSDDPEPDDNWHEDDEY